MRRYDPYRNQVIEGQMCVWLQSYGFHPAIQAKDFKVGDQIVYNWGHAYTVIAIREKSPQWLTFTVEAPDGKVYNQNVKKDTYKPYRKGV